MNRDLEKNDNKLPIFSIDSIWNLSSNKAYLKWRKEKLKWAQELYNAPLIEIKDLANPSKAEQNEIIDRCNKTNMAIYQTPNNKSSDEVRSNIRNFAKIFNLQFAESHRSAGKEEIVAITPSNAPKQKAYIPYSKKPINWHTDGYYNAPDEQVKAMVLHCFKPAQDGGQSQLFDNEIAYIRLRDENPDFIKALMHKEAMSIPQNLEENGDLRPISIGPVFSIDKNNKLNMRYTARTRSIEWRDDKTTKQAVEFLQNLLTNGDPFLITATLKAGQGVLCNNSLHNRTGFDKQNQAKSDRLLFRVRFFNRVREK